MHRDLLPIYLSGELGDYYINDNHFYYVAKILGLIWFAEDPPDDRFARWIVYANPGTGIVRPGSKELRRMKRLLEQPEGEVRRKASLVERPSWAVEHGELF